jgi:hypothetical protein
MHRAIHGATSETVPARAPANFDLASYVLAYWLTRSVPVEKPLSPPGSGPITIVSLTEVPASAG